MIAKISFGWRVAGLVHYLMGPGRFNEHTNQHVVASWDGAPELHQPAPTGDGKFDVEELAADLADPAVAAGIPQREPVRAAGKKARRGPVWHCSLRNEAGDRALSDSEWAEVVTELMDRTEIAPRDDLGACRWVAIRHADDHVHIAAMLVRQDNGRRVWPYNDRPKARRVCEDAEVRLGLTSTAPADRTAAQPSSRAEMEKAERRGRDEAAQQWQQRAAQREPDETSRVWLRRVARIAAVQAQDPEEFFRRLTDLGVQVRANVRPAGQLVGYSVAAPDDKSADGLPIWYSGGALARDLSLPKLLHRWASAPAPAPQIAPAPGERSEVGRAEREAAVGDARAAIEHATVVVAARDGREEADAIAHAAGDMVTALGVVTQHARDGAVVPWEAADQFDRASRTPMLVQPNRWSAAAAALRTAAWRLAAVRSVGGRSRQVSGTAELMVALAALVAEIAAYREQQLCGAQAHAARRTAELLRGSRPARPERGGPARGMDRGDRAPGRRRLSTSLPAADTARRKGGERDERGRAR